MAVSKDVDDLLVEAVVVEIEVVATIRDIAVARDGLRKKLMPKWKPQQSKPATKPSRTSKRIQTKKKSSSSHKTAFIVGSSTK